MQNLLQFPTLYTKVPHDNLQFKFSAIAYFASNGGDKTFIRLSNNGAIYFGKKTKEWIDFRKTSFKTATNHLIENS